MVTKLWTCALLILTLQGEDFVMGATSGTRRLAEGVYSWSPGDNYYSMFVVTSAGVIAIEPHSSKHTERFIVAIKNVTSQPIKYLLISHNHWDHANGGQNFHDVGATVMAHAEAIEWMKANPHKDLYVPDESWEGDKKELTLGGTTIELLYMGMNHGRGTTLFLLPKEKVLYVADLVSPKSVIFSIAPDFNLKEMERTMREIIKLDFSIGVFSHSNNEDPLGGGTKADVQALLIYLEEIRASVNTYINNGTNIFAISSLLKLPKYENWSRYDTDFRMNVQKMALEIYIGPYPWRPKYQGTMSRGSKFHSITSIVLVIFWSFCIFVN